MSKNDFGFYGSGLDGYVHYKQRNINPLLWGEYKVYNVRICV